MLPNRHAAEITGPRNGIAFENLLRLHTSVEPEARYHRVCGPGFGIQLMPGGHAPPASCDCNMIPARMADDSDTQQAIHSALGCAAIGCGTAGNDCAWRCVGERG